MMARALAGPIPGKDSSSAWLAQLRLIFTTSGGKGVLSSAVTKPLS